MSGRGGSRRGILGGRWGFLTGDMKDRVIPDVMNDVYLPQGSTMNISFLDVSRRGGQEGGYLEDV